MKSLLATLLLAVSLMFIGCGETTETDPPANGNTPGTTPGDTTPDPESTDPE